MDHTVSFMIMDNSEWCTFLIDQLWTLVDRVTWIRVDLYWSFK
jgi:hypothetical protein